MDDDNKYMMIINMLLIILELVFDYFLEPNYIFSLYPSTNIIIDLPLGNLYAMGDCSPTEVVVESIDAANAPPAGPAPFGAGPPLTWKEQLLVFIIEFTIRVIIHALTGH